MNTNRYRWNYIILLGLLAVLSACGGGGGGGGGTPDTTCVFDSGSLLDSCTLD